VSADLPLSWRRRALGRPAADRNYALYTTYLALNALHDPMEPVFSTIATYILFPLAGLIAFLLLLGALRHGRTPRAVHSTS
jgi:hypothetical protein